MAKINLETRTGRRIAKKKYTRRFLSIVAVSSVLMSGFAYAKNSSAENGVENKEISVELSTEKIDKDTVKIQLDDFAPLVKSIQLNVTIDGNAKFKEDTIKWLANSDSEDVKTHFKMSDSNKTMEIFIVSNEPLNRVGANLEICEIDVEKASIGNSAYRIDSKVIDGSAYSYVLSDTNKQVTGIDMANLSEDKLTINSAPVISLKSSTSIADGNIVISKGDTFDAKSYIVVNDEEDGEISTDKVTVDKVIKTNQVGTYSITYSVTDSDGDTATLVQTVIVEDVAEENVTNPAITVDKTGMNGDNLTFVAGDEINLLDYITAVDYLDRSIEVKISGDYDLTKAGTYTIIVTAEDRFGNKTEEKVTIVVEEAPSSEEPIEPSEPGDVEENPGNGEEEQPGDGEQNPGSGEEGQPGDGVEDSVNPEEPGNSDETENGTGESGDSVDNPEVSVDPENSEESDDSTNIESNTDNKENNVNKIPQTGQGIFYGITVAIAAVVIGSGVYLLKKKK